MWAYLTQASLLSIFPRRARQMERCGDLVADHAGSAYPEMRANGLFFGKALALLYQGRYAEAEALLDERRRTSDWDTEAGAAYLEPALALVRHLRGRHADALRLLESTHSPWAPNVLFERTTAAAAVAALGDAADAHQRMRDAVTATRTASWQHPLARSDCLVGFAALAALDRDSERAARLAAAVPNMATSTPGLWVLLRHYRDHARDRLDPETRRRCVEEGRALDVDEAIDLELARWDTEDTLSA